MQPNLRWQWNFFLPTESMLRNQLIECVSDEKPKPDMAEEIAQLDRLASTFPCRAFMQRHSSLVSPHCKPIKLRARRIFMETLRQPKHFQFLISLQYSALSDWHNGSFASIYLCLVFLQCAKKVSEEKRIIQLSSEGLENYEIICVSWGGWWLVGSSTFFPLLRHDISWMAGWMKRHCRGRGVRVWGPRLSFARTLPVAHILGSLHHRMPFRLSW